jgi:peptidoglycan/xylan/chitin deacetylase (PgdA/CDA1 family)
VLLYHRVAEEALDPHRLALAPSVFLGQMRELAARFRPRPLTDLASGARTGSLPRGAVALTFDDAYSETIDRISPVLTELGIPATFFAVGNQTLSPQPFWWDTLADLLLGGSLLPPALDIAIDGETRRFATGSGPERRRAHEALHPLLVRASLAARDEAMTALLAWAGFTPPVTGLPLDRVGLLALADRPGHAIGAHGLAHLALAAQSPAARAEEIGGSKAVLEGILGRPVTAFAYPYGDVNSSVARAARGAGYELAVSCEPEPLRATSDPWRLPRIEIHSGNSDRFGAILAEALGLA